MENTRLSKHALNYKPRGRRNLDAPGNDGNASMPEQVKRTNPWRKMLMMMNKLAKSAVECEEVGHTKLGKTQRMIGLLCVVLNEMSYSIRTLFVLIRLPYFVL